MEDKTRLGRGLEEVSQFYLSGGRRDEAGRQMKAIKAHPEKTSIKVYCPGSSLMQSFFLANFALELARNRLAVVVWDCLDGSEAGIETVMKSLIPALDGCGETRVSLYGLPDIVIYNESSNPSESLSALVSTIPCDEGCLLVNTPGHLSAVVNDDLSADCIVMTRTDEKALLASYAYIKVILENGSPGDISLIFDDPGGQEEAKTLFRRFARFIEKKLHCSLHYLGSLRHDEYIDQSMEEARPLMLFQEPSGAKEDLACISRSYLDRRQSRKGG